MPRTPPPGQGKKWSQRITTSEIYCTKSTTLCFFWENGCLGTNGMNETLQIMEGENKVISDDF